MLHERIPLSGLFQKFLTALVLLSVVASLISAVKAQVATLTPVNFPPNITLCEPVNFTWTGGTPPYWLYVYGDVSGKLVAQNTTGIPTSWFVWIPDIPAVPGSSLRFQIGDSATRTTASLSQLVGSEGSSCLGSTTAAAAASDSSITTSQPTPSPSTSYATTLSSSQPPTTSQSAATPAHRGDKLSRAAVAGIAVVATFVGIGCVLASSWYVVARHRSRVRLGQRGKACPCPITTSIAENSASASRVSIPPVRLDTPSSPSPTPLARVDADSELGYSVVANVGGPRGASPVSPSLVMATDPPPSPTENLHLRQPEALLHRIPHAEPGRKRGRVPVEPGSPEPAECRVELDGVTPPAVGDSEGMKISHGTLEPESSTHCPIGYAEDDGWDVRSPSEGTALPPYAP